MRGIRTMSRVPTIRAHSRGRSVLLDVWGKKDIPDAVYYDITWMGFVGSAPSGRMREVFEIVRDARDAGVKTVTDAIGAGRGIAGWEVDRATRNHIKQKGYGDYLYIARDIPLAPTSIPMALTWTIWNPRRAPDSSQLLFLNRAWYLSAGVRRAQRSEHAGAAEVGGSYRQHSTRDPNYLMANSRQRRQKRLSRRSPPA